MASLDDKALQRLGGQRCKELIYAELRERRGLIEAERLLDSGSARCAHGFGLCKEGATFSVLAEDRIARLFAINAS